MQSPTGPAFWPDHHQAKQAVAEGENVIPPDPGLTCQIPEGSRRSQGPCFAWGMSLGFCEGQPRAPSTVPSCVLLTYSLTTVGGGVGSRGLNHVPLTWRPGISSLAHLAHRFPPNRSTKSPEGGNSCKLEGSEGEGTWRLPVPPPLNSMQMSSSQIITQREEARQPPGGGGSPGRMLSLPGTRCELSVFAEHLLGAGDSC